MIYQNMKAYLDRNGIYLLTTGSPREVRCRFCKLATRDVNLYLNYNSIGDAIILCSACHSAYLQANQKGKEESLPQTLSKT